MWVRSQNKADIKKYIGFNIQSCTIYGRDSDPQNIYFDTLGIYKTEERARKVFDLLQEQIAFNEHYSHSGVNTSLCQGYGYAVYEMPEK